MLQLAGAEGKDRRAQQAEASAAASRLTKAEAQLRALRTGGLPKVPALQQSCMKLRASPCRTHAAQPVMELSQPQHLLQSLLIVAKAASKRPEYTLSTCACEGQASNSSAAVTSLFAAWRQIEVGSVEEVIGKMQADGSGEWASVMFIAPGAGPNDVHAVFSDDLPLL